MAPKYTLTYFDFPGRGEAIRMLFKHAGVDFEDKRISFEDFANIKENVDECPAGYLPILKASNGKKIVQTASIIRYLANEFNLFGGGCNVKRAIIDSIIDTLKEIHDELIQVIFYVTDDNKNEARTKLEQKIRKDFKYLEYRIKENGNKDVFVGSKITAADVYFIDVIDNINIGIPGNKILDDFTLLQNINNNVRNSKHLKKYLTDRESKNKVTPKYTLTYFDFHGRGEAIRMLFNHAAVDFEDKRISFDDFAKIKENVEECPAGYLPLLTAPDGKKLVQTSAIIRYIANEFNLYGECNVQRAIIDSIIDTLKELHDELIRVIFYVKDDDKPAEKVKLEEKIRKSFKYLEFRIKENDFKDFFVGSKISAADVYLVDVVDNINSCITGHKILDDFPLLKNVDAKTRESKYLSTYLATRK